MEAILPSQDGGALDHCFMSSFSFLYKGGKFFWYKSAWSGVMWTPMYFMDVSVQVNWNWDFNEDSVGGGMLRLRASDFELFTFRPEARSNWRKSDIKLGRVMCGWDR